jgi:regulator of cell morphogenesis and NO signaling
MAITAADTVREIAVALPGATRVFERMGIDYCCGGAKPLEEACASAGVETAALLGELEALGEAGASAPPHASESLAGLARYIVDTHHTFTSDELARLEKLFAKVCGVHGERHPELLQLREVFIELRDDLLPHMAKEERVLFPYITAMEQAVTAGRPVPTPMFGTVRNPVRMMSVEHDAAGDLLARLRQLSGGYAPPADACISFRTLYAALEGLERDLHEHIHLENNILFPRAVEMEARSR